MGETAVFKDRKRGHVVADVPHSRGLGARTRQGTDHNSYSMPNDLGGRMKQGGGRKLDRHNVSLGRRMKQGH
jgi:hypothetical protein